MRVITQKSIMAFINAESFRKDNTEVEILPNVTILKLFNNTIAYRYNDPERTISIQTCGWNTVSTRERLNGIPGVHVNIKKGILFLNDKKWDGELIDIK